LPCDGDDLSESHYRCHWAGPSQRARKMSYYALRFALSLSVLTSCGGPTQQPRVQLQIEPGAALTFADCAVVQSKAPILARVLVNGDTSNPCALTVELNATSGAYSVSGACANIPAAPQVNLTLQWYVMGPATGNFVLLAESTGSVKIPGDKQTYLAQFVAVKSKGTSTDDPAERDRFNCDRTGVYTCDVNMTPGTVTQDVDTCSNLEELCTNTLFDADSTHLHDSCP